MIATVLLILLALGLYTCAVWAVAGTLGEARAYERFLGENRSPHRRDER